MNLNSFFKKIINEERGIATVLTIGVLALLAALAIGFLSESMILQKISNNNLNLERSRLLAQSMVQRTIAAVTQYNATTSDSLITFNSQRLLKGVNGTDTDDAPDTDDLATSLSTTFNNIEYFTWDEDASDSPQWQYIRTTRNTDGDSMLVGRVAYVVINNIGKLDPSAIVDSGSNVTSFYPSAVTEDTSLYTGFDPGPVKILGRPGRDVREIFAGNINTSILADTLQYMSASNADNSDPSTLEGSNNRTGQLLKGTRWFDISEFIGAVGVGNTTSDTQIRTDFNNWFFTDNPADPEAFWIDIDADDIIDSQYEQFHRFNLARTDWDDITVDSFTTTSAVVAEIDDTDTDGMTIPWLKNWKSIPAGDTNSDTIRNQIIANLIDYCDSDDTATTDYPAIDPPTYVGLEKSQYINELTFTLSGSNSLLTSPIVGGSNDGRYYNEAVVKVNILDLELVNMYGTDITVNNAKITISANCTFSVYKSGIETASQLIEFDNLSINLNSFSSSEQSYSTDRYTDNSSLKVIEGIHTDEQVDTGAISNFNITSLKVKLTASNSLADFANIVESLTISPSPLLPETVAGTPTTEYLAFNAQINDPRQNLNGSDWTVNMVNDSNATQARHDVNSTIANASEEVPTTDGKNTAFAPDVDGNESDSDYESGATDPWEVSTAYIRNAPMQSPWELGFIHRGAAWQTINLKAYNMTEGASPDAGGNGYADGDANVLDQIKMTANTETYGKVNINSTSSTSTPHLNIYTALLQDIYLTGTNSTDKSNYDNPGTQGGTRVNGDIPNNIAVDFVTNSTTTPYKTRAQILRPTNGVTTLHNGTEIAQTNDAAQEEIIGKFINLTTAGTSNNLTLITVAQTIKDVGDVTVTKNGTPIPTEFNRYDENADAILAEQKILVILVRDPITFKWQIKKLRYINL